MPSQSTFMLVTAGVSFDYADVDHAQEAVVAGPVAIAGSPFFTYQFDTRVCHARKTVITGPVSVAFSSQLTVLSIENLFAVAAWLSR